MATCLRWHIAVIAKKGGEEGVAGPSIIIGPAPIDCNYPQNNMQTLP